MVTLKLKIYELQCNNTLRKLITKGPKYGEPSRLTRLTRHEMNRSFEQLPNKLDINKLQFS